MSPRRRCSKPVATGYIVEEFGEEACAGYGNLDGRRVTPQQAIKLYCLACQGGHEFSWRLADGDVEPPFRPHAEVRECTTKTCWLHPFRTGRNPYTKRKGNPAWRKDKGAGK
jgi:hypothetical protein